METTQEYMRVAADASAAQLITPDPLPSDKRCCIVVLSGGQDSTTCLYYALNTLRPDIEVYCLTFDYGQTHRRELNAAAQIVALARKQFPDRAIQHEFVEVPNILKGTSPLVRDGDALEQYKDWNALPGGIEKTFVPMRNQLFLTIAANRAAAVGASVIVTGVSQEDYGGYPDCRENFIAVLEAAINASLDGVHFLLIQTPLMHKSKADTVRMAKALNGCWEAMALTHTAYDGQYPPTGKDHATLLRAKGFHEAGEADPLVVKAWVEGLMPLPETDNYNGFRDDMPF
jgi:7-cyano-7-deazaguanine synthase